MARSKSAEMIAINTKSILTFLIFFLVTIGVFAQEKENKILDKVISLKASNTSIEDILDKISFETRIYFSYNSKQINTNQRIDVQSENTTIKSLLDKLFKGSVVYKTTGNYIILTPVKKTSAVPKKAKTYSGKIRMISGYIYDSNSRQAIEAASIYHPKTLASSLSKSDGYFDCMVNAGENSISLNIKKAGYKDVVIDIQEETANPLNIYLDPSISIIVSQQYQVDTLSGQDRDSVHVNYLPPTNSDINILANDNIRSNIMNIGDTIYRNGQLSFLPGIATYGNMSGNIIFNYSFNFIGVTGGVKKLEIGAISNFVNHDAGAIQIAGISNVVGGNFNGVQAGGLINYVRGKTKGVQLGGLLNINKDSVSGIQIGGLFNFNNAYTKGIQFSGLINVNHATFSGIQGGGLINVQKESMKGIQLAGLSNVADKVKGLQMGGLSNSAQKMKGHQFAGMYNKADTIEGFQFSGFINHAKYISNYQFGFINIADSIGGLPIGFFNFVKKGYHKLELYVDDFSETNVSFRSGVKALHNNFYFTRQPRQNGMNAVGYGLGTSITLSKKLDLDFDISMHHVWKGDITSYYENNLYKAHIGLNWQITKGLALAAGPVMNFNQIDADLILKDASFKDMADSYLWSKNDVVSNTLFRGWIGYRVGLRFF